MSKLEYLNRGTAEKTAKSSMILSRIFFLGRTSDCITFSNTNDYIQSTLIKPCVEKSDSDIKNARLKPIDDKPCSVLPTMLNPCAVWYVLVNYSDNPLRSHERMQARFVCYKTTQYKFSNIVLNLSAHFVWAFVLAKEGGCVRKCWTIAKSMHLWCTKSTELFPELNPGSPYSYSSSMIRPYTTGCQHLPVRL